jgi:hypothetical protein
MNDDPDPIFWVWLVAAAVAAVLLLYSFAALSEDCMRSMACTGTRFVPHIDGVPVDVGDLDEIECQFFLDDMDIQTKPFTRLECIEEPIARQEL